MIVYYGWRVLLWIGDNRDKTFWDFLIYLMFFLLFSGGLETIMET